MKIGNLVQVKYILDQVYTGVLVDIQKKRAIFSEEYGVVQITTYIHVLCEGKIEVLDLEECIVEVISD